MSENMEENSAEKLETPVEIPTKTSAETPVETAIETPVETIAETPAQTATETPAETSVETPAESSNETPAETPAEPLNETPAKTPAESSNETPAKTPAETSNETPAEIKTKQDFREKVWCDMVEKQLSNSFRSLCSRVPYFKGATEATKRLCELEAFRKSKLLMISPDKFVILLSLKKEKEILIPTPRLLNGLFLHIKNAAGLPEHEAKNAIIRNNIKQIENPVGFNTTDLKVDMLILGSVCVNKAGCRIGDGEGFADLEYAILSKMKAVNENTMIVTMVHDCQILDDLPNKLFESHDVPVDIIITPTQTFFVNPRLPKPKDIIWSAISKRRLAAIPVLGEIKQFEEKEGKVLTLKEQDSDEESRSQEKIRVKKMISEVLKKYRSSKSRPNSEIKENGTTEKSKEIRRKSFLRKRRLQKFKDNNDENNGSENKLTGNQTNNVKIPRPARRFTPRNHVDFSLRLSNIASTVRVRDLKNALLERGVKPTSITWRGQKGFCYLHFGKLRKKSISPEKQQPVQVDSIVANLHQLKIGETPLAGENEFIVVEPAEPVTRIEVTDVSAV